MCNTEYTCLDMCSVSWPTSDDSRVDYSCSCFDDSDSDGNEGDGESSIRERIAREYGFTRPSVGDKEGEEEEGGNGEEDDPLDAFMAGIEVRVGGQRVLCRPVCEDGW